MGFVNNLAMGCVQLIHQYFYETLNHKTVLIF